LKLRFSCIRITTCSTSSIVLERTAAGTASARVIESGSAKAAVAAPTVSAELRKKSRRVCGLMVLLRPAG
jgi:hypothetical protein